MFNWSYNESQLKLDTASNGNKPYCRCTKTVMDTINDPEIVFDENGISNYYHYYFNEAGKHVFTGEVGQHKIDAMVKELRNNQKGKYDCIVGLSGGVDSTYLIYKLKEWGITPLVVHFDYGWNLELAVQNIEQTLKYTGFDLYTHVMDWEDFKSLQRAYFKAGVLDLDVPADHLIFAAINTVAKKFNIRYILNGFNFQSEALLPSSWNYNRKFDLRNLRDINKKFGDRRLRNIPLLGFWKQQYNSRIYGLKGFLPLNYFNYHKADAKKELIEKMHWVDYGGKHFENIFTRFYQGYILPVRFGIDKRKPHLSTLICSNQLTLEEAVEELQKPPYDLKIMEDDYNFVYKKLSFSIDEFDQCLNGPIKSHSEFKDEIHLEKFLSRISKIVKRN